MALVVLSAAFILSPSSVAGSKPKVRPGFNRPQRRCARRWSPGRALSFVFVLCLFSDRHRLQMPLHVNRSILFELQLRQLISKIVRQSLDRSQFRNPSSQDHFQSCQLEENKRSIRKDRIVFDSLVHFISTSCFIRNVC